MKEDRLMNELESKELFQISSLGSLIFELK
jgi:hypothetical protein